MTSSSPTNESIAKIRDFLCVNNDAPKHTRNFSYHSTFQNGDQAEKMPPKITIKQLTKKQKQYNKETLEFDMVETDEEMIFDLENVSPSLANALRRIMIADVATMAIHKVVVNRNTSLLKDEILAHRLGLVPILADPSKFRFKDDYKMSLLEQQASKRQNIHDPPLPEELYQNETILFQLKIKCRRNSNGQVVNSHVYSSHLKWVPFGDQETTFADRPIRPVHDDILIAKLAPGQELNLDLYCQKGTGKEHAKFSPVATATYRLLPHIEFKRKFVGDEARALVKKCPMDVYDIEDDVAVVANPRQCTMCRECIRENNWDQKIALYRKKQHFIFSVETTGILTPKQIFKEALKVLYSKAYYQLRDIEAVEQEEEDEINGVTTFK